MAYGAGDMPLTKGQLERYRLRLGKRARASQLGGHLRRRQGDSLEFREFRKYVPGDDARRIDWRASARYGGESDYLIRAFHAEDRLNLALSIDLRHSMDLPEGLSKRTLAIWTAAALAYLTLRQGDTAVAYPLFGTEAEVRLDNRRLPSPRAIAERFDATWRRAPDATEDLWLPGLTPRHVWVVFSDFYMNEPAIERLRSAVLRAQQTNCWVLLVEFDSWPMERSLLIEQERLVLGPGVEADNGLKLMLSVDQADEAARRLKEHKQKMFRGTGRGGMDHVRWPIEAEDESHALQRYEHSFLAEPHFSRLFRRGG